MKTDISSRLTKEQFKFIKEEAERQRRPIAAVVRNLIDDLYQSHKTTHSGEKKPQGD